MNRKTIAVCVTGYDWEYESRIISGIHERCVANDINLLVFASLVKRPELNSTRVISENAMLGEMEIFNLINYDMVDGIIILGDSLVDEKVLFRVSERAKERGIPTVNINDPLHKLDVNVLLSDKTAMEYVVRHLVEDHGLRKIDFIGGFPGNLQTEERLAAYKRVLTENNIPIEESRIFYGEFWRKTIDCTAEIVNSGDIPEAIVCASDTMAIFCMDYLKEHGFKLPEDIVVTGFDGLPDCEMYEPTLTTVRRAFSESGAAATDLLMDIWSGKEVPEEIEVNSVLVKHHSCGCADKAYDEGENFFNKRFGDLITFKEFNTYILDMNTRFSNAESSLELYEQMNVGAKFFKLNRLYICVSADIENNGEVSRAKDGGYVGLSPMVKSMIQFGHDVPVGTEFPSSQLTPEDILHGEKCVFMAFSPMYFKDIFLGYVAFEPSKIKGNGDFFPIWLMALSNNTGSFYMKQQLEYAVGQLRKLYIRDPLTGLYNRRGMDKESAVLIDKAWSEKLYLSVVCADIDNLKPINDIFGHNAGDNAIIRAGQALSESAPDGYSVCTRTGGDEFCVVCAYKNEVDVKGYIAEVERRIEEYNAVSGLPYKIGCSCGAYTVKAEHFTDLEELLRNADAEMYRVKTLRKANRV